MLHSFCKVFASITVPSGQWLTYYLLPGFLNFGFVLGIYWISMFQNLMRVCA